MCFGQFTSTSTRIASRRIRIIACNGAERAMRLVPRAGIAPNCASLNPVIPFEGIFKRAA
jgi:hypothetical protein